MESAKRTDYWSAFLCPHRKIIVAILITIQHCHDVRWPILFTCPWHIQHMKLELLRIVYTDILSWFFLTVYDILFTKKASEKSTIELSQAAIHWPYCCIALSYMATPQMRKYSFHVHVFENCKVTISVLMWICTIIHASMFTLCPRVSDFTALVFIYNIRST